MQMIVPHFGLLIFRLIICLTISVPLISSPCKPALNKTTGPSILERSIIIGILSLVIVCNLAISTSTILLSPGKILSPNNSKGLLFILIQ